MELNDLRQAIGVIDKDFVFAIARRIQQPLNPQLYANVEAPASPSALAEAIVNVPDTKTKSLIIRGFYKGVVLKTLCKNENASNSRECFDLDLACLETLARRFNYSSLVGLTKQRTGIHTSAPNLEASITNTEVENSVYNRLRRFAIEAGLNEEQQENLIRIYHDWVVPASRILQVLQLKQRQRFH